MKLDKTMGVLYSFAYNYVKYANMEGFAETVTYRTVSYVYGPVPYAYLL